MVKTIKLKSKKEREEADRKRIEEKRNNRTKSNIYSALNLPEGEDIVMFKPKKGKNSIDIVPYMITTNNDPSGEEPGIHSYGLDAFVHKQVGPKNETIVCPARTFPKKNKKCPICEEKDKAYSDGNEDYGKSLTAKHRTIFNIIDHKDEKYDKVKIWDVAWFTLEKEIDDLIDEEASTGETRNPYHHETGLTITFRGRDAMMGTNPYIAVKNVGLEERDEQYDDGIFEATYLLDSMLKINTYDEIAAKFYATDEDEEDDDEEEIEDEEETPAPKKSKRKAKLKKKLEEDYPDYDVIPENDDEEEKPKRKKKTIKNKCPHDHKFGEDFEEEEDECTVCKVYDECEEKYDELND